MLVVTVADYYAGPDDFPMYVFVRVRDADGNARRTETGHADSDGVVSWNETLCFPVSGCVSTVSLCEATMVGDRTLFTTTPDGCAKLGLHVTQSTEESVRDIKNKMLVRVTEMQREMNDQRKELKAARGELDDLRRHTDGEAEHQDENSHQRTKRTRYALRGGK